MNLGEMFRRDHAASAPLQINVFVVLLPPKNTFGDNNRNWEDKAESSQTNTLSSSSSSLLRPN
jgi:hypothetical protein